MISAEAAGLGVPSASKGGKEAGKEVQKGGPWGFCWQLLLVIGRTEWVREWAHLMGRGAAQLVLVRVI